MSEERKEGQRGIRSLLKRLWPSRLSENVLESWRANLASAVTVAVMGITIITLVLVVLGWIRGEVSPFSIRLLVAPMMISLPLYGWMLLRFRKGVVYSTLLWLLSVIFVGLAIVVFFWGGARSPAWVFFIWAVMAAGMLLGPKWVLRTTVATVVYFAIIALLTFRFPAFFHPPEDILFFLGLFIALLFLLVVSLTYIDVSTKERVIEELMNLKQSLEESRTTLEERVRERTAMVTERARQLEIIADLNRFMIGSTSLEILLSTVVDLLSARLDFYHVGVFLLDDSGQWLRLYAASSPGGKRMLARGHKLQLGGEGIVGYVGATLRPRIASDVGEDAVWFDNPDLPETRSEMALPLISADQLIGVLDIQSRRVNAFSSEDVETLSILANALSVAISNVRTVERYRRTLERLERYRSEDVVVGWRKALNRRKRSLAMLYDRMEIRTLSEEDLAVRSASEREEIVVPEVKVEERDGVYRLLVPLRVHSLQLGMLRFESPRRWAPDEVEMVRAIVEQISLALENARLLEDSRFRAEQEAARSQIVASIRSSVQIETILRSAAQELGRALDVERVRVQLLSAAFRGEDGGE